MSNVFVELRLALRVLSKNPGTSAMAIAVLALGIGANSAMFSLVDALLLEPLPIERADELFGIFGRDRETGDYSSVSYPNYVDLRERSEAFSEIAAHNIALVGIEAGETSRRGFIEIVSSNYLRLFGVTPLLGRDFLPEEETGDNARVALISYNLWQQRGGSTDVLGTQIEINEVPYTIVGVMPPRFAGHMVLITPDLFVPISSYRHLGTRTAPVSDRASPTLMLIGRVEESRQQASAEVSTIARAFEDEWPEANRRLSFEVHPLQRMGVSTDPGNDSPMMMISALLLGLSMVVLLVAGLNLASVQGARTLSRQSEIALRLALGSGRLRIMRGLLLEGLLLALAGGAIGLVLAWIVPQLLASSFSRLAPFDISLSSGVDVRIVLATFFFCLLATLIFGLLPALRVSRPDLSSSLREGAKGSQAGRRRVFSRGNLPVVAEIALTLVLLVVGGLFLRAAINAVGLEPGFDLDGSALVEIDSSFLGLDDDQGQQLSSQLVERLQALPGVESVAVAAIVPFGMTRSSTNVQPIEQPLIEDGGEQVLAAQNSVGPSYFETLEIPVLRGRSFRDNESESVVIVDRVLAERLWPDQDPLGRSLRFVGQMDDYGRPVEAEVVGVVATIRDSLLDSGDRAHVFRPFEDNYRPNHHLHIRYRDGRKIESELPAIRAAALEVEDNLPILTLRSMRQHLDESLDLWLMKTAARLFLVFGATALLLALAGVYGVRAYSVAARTRELGIRGALGSTSGETLWLILSEGLRLTVAGGAVGLLLSLTVSRLLSRLLLTVSPWDPAVFVGAGTVLLAVMGVACLVPARKAARMDPLEALRYE